MKCNDFIPLINDMKTNNIDKEHYTFDYNGFRFDVILSITRIVNKSAVGKHPK